MLYDNIRITLKGIDGQRTYPLTPGRLYPILGDMKSRVFKQREHLSTAPEPQDKAIAKIGMRQK
jgi:hypothetical protein